MTRRRVGQQRPGGARAPYRGPGWTSSPTLGVDVGGVIVALAGRDEDASFFDFFGRTRIPEASLHFVRERRDKAPVCQRLGVTHFVDDRLDVLAHLDAVEHRYLFLGGTDRQVPDGSRPHWATAVDTWAGLAALLRESAPAQAGDRP